MSVTVITAPDYIGLSPKKISIFLGGSIEMGVARDWQTELIQHLNTTKYADKIEILNPRRLAWDASWPIDDPNHEELGNQINWELYYQDKADVLIYNFARGTVSPITLLELGTYSARNPLIHIEGGYKRHANVKITADHFGWEYHEAWENFLSALDQRMDLQIAFRQNVLASSRK
jgi:hypothetical protein